MKKIIIILTVLFFASCKTGYVANYKIVTAKGNFYVNDFILQRDSIHF